MCLHVPSVSYLPGCRTQVHSFKLTSPGVVFVAPCMRRPTAMCGSGKHSNGDPSLGRKR